MRVLFYKQERLSQFSEVDLNYYTERTHHVTELTVQAVTANRMLHEVILAAMPELYDVLNAPAVMLLCVEALPNNAGRWLLNAYALEDIVWEGPGGTEHAVEMRRVRGPAKKDITFNTLKNVLTTLKSKLSSSDGLS